MSNQETEPVEEAEGEEQPGQGGEQAEQEKKEDPSNDDVYNKYRTSAEITNNALTYVLSLCTVGARIVEICSEGDKFIIDATSKIFTKNKKMQKGVGFPTCVSVNNLVGHFSPMADDQTILKEGDLVKIDLGVQVDGYVTVAAHTIVLGDAAITGSLADALTAAATAVEASIRLLKAGKSNTGVSKIIEEVAKEYGVNPVQGVLSHQMQRYVIDGEKVIMARADSDQKVAEVTFEPNEVYAVDIVLSTGEGKPKEADSRTTVYKRSPTANYQLKMKASRAVFAQINKQNPTFPFTIRGYDDKTIRFAIKECSEHDLVTAYPVLVEKEGEFVVHFKYTAVISAKGVVKLAGLPIDTTRVKSEKVIASAEIKTVLATGLGGNNKKKKNKK